MNDFHTTRVGLQLKQGRKHAGKMRGRFTSEALMLRSRPRSRMTSRLSSAAGGKHKLTSRSLTTSSASLVVESCALVLSSLHACAHACAAHSFATGSCRIWSGCPPTNSCCPCAARAKASRAAHPSSVALRVIRVRASSGYCGWCLHALNACAFHFASPRGALGGAHWAAHRPQVPLSGPV